MPEFEDELREHGLVIAGDIDGDPPYEPVHAIYYLAEAYHDPSVGIFGWHDDRVFRDVTALEAYWRSERDGILARATAAEED